MLFSYGNIYLLYIYFLQTSQSAASPAGQEREYLQSGSGSSFSCHMDQVCSCYCWVLAGKKKKKNAFKKDKMKRRALFFSLLLCSSLGALCPPSLPAVAIQMPSDRVQPLGESWGLLAPKRDQ